MEAKPYTVIKPRKGWQLIDFKELRSYRDLFYFLVIRDIKVRYKQTVLGGLWAIIQPLFMMLIFTIFFGKLAKIPSEGVPYPVFNFSALVVWTYFANAITFSGNSLIQDREMIAKVYFPRLFAPLAPVIGFLLDFAIAFIILLGMMLYYHIYPTVMTLLVPLLLLIVVLTASGTGLLLSALNVKYRDIKYTMTLLVQLWMFASPVVYPTSIVPEEYHLIYALNPMAGVIESFRSVLLGTIAFPTQMLLVSAMASLVIFAIGAFYFKQTERYFADVI